MNLQNKKTTAYISLCFVILVWGIGPIFTKELLSYYSPMASVLHTSIMGFLFFFLISIKNLKNLNSTYFKVAVTTGIFYSAADLMQKVGLDYTTPTRYAFLENLSCIIVPIILFLLIKKRPTVITILASVLCLVSAFILTSPAKDSSVLGIGIGEILCALAGLCYGVNIAVTGIYAKKLDVKLYLMIQMGVCVIISSASSIIFNATGIESFEFSFNPKIFMFKCALVLVSSSICWLLRTNAMKHVSPTVVAVIMPMASVVTAVASVISGKDTLTVALVVGAFLGLVATILSELGDRPKKQKNIGG